MERSGESDEKKNIKKNSNIIEEEKLNLIQRDEKINKTKMFEEKENTEHKYLKRPNKNRS